MKAAVKAATKGLDSLARAVLLVILGLIGVCLPAAQAAPPTVTLTSPSANQVFVAPAAITLAATAADSDGSVIKVEFYQGTTLLGTATGAPYAVTWSNPPPGGYSLTAKATDNLGETTTSAAANITVTAGGTPINVAAAANGGVATASSFYNANYLPSAAIDGDRKGLHWGTTGGGWNDATANAYPDWLQVTFSATQTIGEIDVFTIQDNYLAPLDPVPSMTFTQYGITAFQVQYWDGAGWVDVPGGAVTGNTQVWRQFSFAPITTDRIRVLVTGALASYSRIAQVEAWTATGGSGNAPPSVSLTSPTNGATFAAPASVVLTATAGDTDGSVARVEFYRGATLLGTATSAPYTWTDTGLVAGTYSYTAVAHDNLGASTTSPAATITVTASGTASVNVAAAANGGIATASSTYSATYPPSGAIDGDRKSLHWGTTGGGWNDATTSAYPDWLQVTFSATQTIGEIDVFTVQDTYQAPLEPTSTMSFSLYGITAFQVQYWDGAGWVDVPGGAVTGNTHVWRQFTFAPITTDRIRVLVNGALASYSRITQVEAWTAPGATGNVPPTVSLTSPANGATFTAPASVSLAATAGDADVSISRVDFHRGVTLIGTATSAPYTWTDTGLAAGTYSYTAVAYDNAGAFTTSAAAAITVTGGGTPINVAAAANGGVATASSAYHASYSFLPSGAINGDRKGLHWGTGGGWNDATANAFPDWLQVTFSATQTIGEIDIFTIQDNWQAPLTPTLSMTFTRYGITAFQVQYWDGAGWVDVPGGNVTGNTHVWRQFSFAPITTDRIRVLVNGALASYSRIAQVEAWTATGGSGNAPPSVSLTSPTNGASFAAPATIALAATASDADGSIAKVEFYQGTTLIGTATTAPYTATWNNVTSGTYSLTAKATDNGGLQTTSGSINVSVIANSPPTISLTSPTPNQNFTAPANVTLTASASDPDNNLAKVEFFQNGSLIASLLSAPYTVPWNDVAQGSYQLTAVATDATGAQTTSAAVTITVTAAQASLYFIHSDHLATPRLITNESNQIVWRNLPTVEPFGNGPVEDDPAATGHHFVFNLRFPGQYADRETKLAYNFYRDYDPGTGRFPQADPIGLAGGINTYGYVNGNPLSLSDPTGLDAYRVNRDLQAFGSSAASSMNPLTHTFVAITNPDGSIANTYSWGNEANLTGWNLNQPLDLKTAAEAIAAGKAERVGGADLDPFVRDAYAKVNKDAPHNNGIVTFNCKLEADHLLFVARQRYRAANGNPLRPKY